ncbi:hypothetical protein CONPUDRAFT_91251 [Coniophora puteana RWD-64-598 SS2]|uniref:Uncharacterized protein n=1 Tax=Coniophora puteana (strain RWD-64-598) TaxID=741705 RepID=A0A5M3MIC6_CONPW|nr:uncharacterized protein CONPUDRAFT_91251 [Coniophora puteana RWD-64-598 SS2]EIW78797.1 hypothetical protein CONPUDRAFT_91251 [Coniophora puteana RWD-64-598 SS2]
MSEQQYHIDNDDMLPPLPHSFSSSSTLVYRRRYTLPHLSSSASTLTVSTLAQDTPY